MVRPGENMLIGVKIILLGVALALSAGVQANANDTPDFVAASIVNLSTLECEKPCDTRFPDGECQADMKCLMKNLFSSNEGSTFAFVSDEKLDDGASVPSSSSSSSSSSCREKCLFKDKKDNCRLDFVCTLNRDVEETLRFLMKHNFDAETAVLLSLSASSNAKITDGGSGRGCNKYARPASASCDSSCKFKNNEGNCNEISNCPIGSGTQGPTSKVQEEEPEENMNNGDSGRERVAVSPIKRCSEPCEYRNPEGKCIVDYDCANAGP